MKLRFELILALTLGALGANCVSAAAPSDLKACAIRSMSQLTGLTVVSVNVSSTQAQVVLSNSAYDLVMSSEKSGGDLYDDTVTAVSVAKLCWRERDPSAAGIKVDVVTQDGSMIAKDY
jgi:hypothetical protein